MYDELELAIRPGSRLNPSWTIQETQTQSHLDSLYWQFLALFHPGYHPNYLEQNYELQFCNINYPTVKKYVEIPQGNLRQTPECTQLLGSRYMPHF